MKIISWNVNSIKIRGAQLRDYLARENPDIALLQEIKAEQFPAEEFAPIRSELLFKGQKAYNGVAALALEKIAPVLTALPGDEADDQARYLEFDYKGLRIINIYAPNGNPRPGPKYDYKLSWMKRLYGRLKALREERVPLIIGGDFNVIPEPRDCYDPGVWREDALFALPTRQAWRAILNLGFIDAFRAAHPDAAKAYSFWDYQAGCWPQNKGIRIDHFLLSPGAADRLKDCRIDSGPRGLEQPSDHTPVVLEIV